MTITQKVFTLRCITKCCLNTKHGLASRSSRSYPVLRYFEAVLNYVVGRHGIMGRGNANASSLSVISGETRLYPPFLSFGAPKDTIFLTYS